MKTSKRKKEIFVGYQQNTKAFRVFLTQDKKVKVASSMTFEPSVIEKDTNTNQMESTSCTEPIVN